MKPMTDKQYIKNPNHCPACRSGNVSGGEINVDGNTAWQEVTCYDCRAKWNDLYRLTGYADLVVPKKDKE